MVNDPLGYQVLLSMRKDIAKQPKEFIWGLSKVVLISLTVGSRIPS